MKTLLTILLLPSIANAQIITDANNFATIPDAVYQCSCMTNSPDGDIYSQTYSANSVAELSATCHNLEGNFVSIGSRRHAEGYAALLACEPRVVSKAKLLTSGKPTIAATSALFEQINSLSQKVDRLTNQVQSSGSNAESFEENFRRTTKDIETPKKKERDHGQGRE